MSSRLQSRPVSRASAPEFGELPGKGPAFVRTKLKNVTSGKIVDKTFNAGTKVETATVDRSDFQYLYNDGTDYIFMDEKTYEQVHVSPQAMGDAANYLLENGRAMIAQHNGQVLYVELPASVVLEVTHTEPGLQGDRSTGGTGAEGSSSKLCHTTSTSSACSKAPRADSRRRLPM